jgi:hypothetical protein
MRLTLLIGTTIVGVLLARTPAQAQHGHDHDDDRRSGSEKEHEKDHSKDHGSGQQKEHGNSGAAHADQRRDGGPEHVHPQPVHEQHTEVHSRREEPRHEQPRQPERVREVRHVEHEHDRREAWESHRATHWEHEHHSWHERGGYRGYRIPEARFHEHFGHGRWFRVQTAPVLVVGGYPRFRYGGFWFSVVDPWPEYWARTWYETDDVYIDYVNDGYYMYNRRHPGVAIAINVSL